MPVSGDRPDSDRPHLYVRRSGQQGQFSVSGPLPDLIRVCPILPDQQYLAEKKKDLAGLERRTAV